MAVLHEQHKQAIKALLESPHKVFYPQKLQRALIAYQEEADELKGAWLICKAFLGLRFYHRWSLHYPREFAQSQLIIALKVREEAASLLRGDAAFANFSAVAAHSDPQCVVVALHHLKKAGLLMGEAAQVMRVAIAGYSQPFVGAEVLCELNVAGLFVGEEGQLNLKAMCSFQKPQFDLGHDLIRLSKAGLLGGEMQQANLRTMIRRQHQIFHTFILRDLASAGLLTGTLAQANFDAFSDIPMFKDDGFHFAINIMLKTGLLNQERLDLLIAHKNILFGTQHTHKMWEALDSNKYPLTSNQFDTIIQICCENAENIRVSQALFISFIHGPLHANFGSIYEIYNNRHANRLIYACYDTFYCAATIISTRTILHMEEIGLNSPLFERISHYRKKIQIDFLEKTLLGVMTDPGKAEYYLRHDARFTKEDKIEATKALIATLKGETVDLRPHLKLLKKGSLSSFYLQTSYAEMRLFNRKKKLQLSHDQLLRVPKGANESKLGIFSEKKTQPSMRDAGTDENGSNANIIFFQV